MKLDTCVAMTQGSIGYWLQNALINQFNQLKMTQPVVSLVTQMRVDADDPSFKSHLNQLAHSYQKKKLMKKQK